MKFNYTLKIEITQDGEEIKTYGHMGSGQCRKISSTLKSIKSDINNNLKKAIEEEIFCEVNHK